MKVKKAGTILINLRNKKIGLVYRKNKDDYSFPKGHLEKGETLQVCAIRETEEETGKRNHLINEKEICIMRYITPLGEDVECYYYLAVDDGESERKIEENLKEQVIWVSPENVKEKLSYDNLKTVWDKAEPYVTDIFSNITPAKLTDL